MPITPVTKLLFSKSFVRKEYPVLLNRLLMSYSDINITATDGADAASDDDNDTTMNDGDNNKYSQECSLNQGKLKMITNYILILFDLSR